MMIHLALAGRESRVWALDVESIESYSACRYDESYERDARSLVRTKSGDSRLVREEPYQIDAQIKGVLEAT